MAGERQAADAIRFYDSKSWDYDATWHNDFTSRFMSYLEIEPGQHVLDLACGTGLLTFREAEAVGPQGQVVGVDVTPGMLAVATHKKTQGGDKYANTTFLMGDVLHLDETEELKGKQFDVITVASALVLFPDPKAAIEHWAGFLKPGGVIAMDATHPRNLVSGMVLERVARRLQLPIPYNRSWSKSEDTLKQTMESAGLKVEQVLTVENQAGYGKRVYELEQWDDFFVENVIVKDVARTFANNEIRRKAQGIYKEEWGKLAIDGKVEEVDSVFLGIARRPADGSRYVPPMIKDDVVFRGGCRCGGVQYTSSAAPSDITLCHCRACQQLSGSGFLAFTHVPTKDVTFSSQETRTTLKLSSVAERTFCSGCGAPISMTYPSDPDGIGLCMATVDLESLKTDSTPKVVEHIFLQERAPWVVLAEDGTERWGTSADAHLLAQK
ncbi:protein-l-isoaspartate(d-aspartate) o-methyltransferase [Stemphylium lycopersici]|uniref:S-adenosyl-L-methionine-dependent methyltransferase n=1 Tax=Stemphylium lycopersici TaxID=183478 RepID=A0A364NA53_STELY|nr:protein-l-isoaspartate(d-aspartate) o-methyltransferase [Stemphylium lycopersici]RAR14208.1 S-adenosyl-L-methionine-dependent methyltransferase [Stemphylium lycopersici]